MKKNGSISASTSSTWKYLVEHFTPEYIENRMEMQEYVVGFGSSNKSFCYLVEVDLKELGDIRGANSSEFGLWYGTHGKDKRKQYRATKRAPFNGDVNHAFSEIKKALAKLIREAQQLQEFEDLESILNGMFKYKIMYLYNPEIMLPSFVLKDLQYFERKLEIIESNSYEEAQKQLLHFKKSNYPDFSNHEFMIFLYKMFGKYHEAGIKEINEKTDYELNKRICDRRDPKDKYITTVRERVRAKRTSEGVYYYPRDYKMALYALANAEHKCENNIDHYCFQRRNGLPYTEVHHLIPLCYYDDFKNSLDVPENIVSLCSSCHNEIHYGLNADAIITKLYHERKEKLKEAGIEISLERLLKMYESIFKTK